jgi:hypothetical protein
MAKRPPPVRSQYPVMAANVVGVDCVGLDVFDNQPWRLIATFRLSWQDAMVVAAALQAAAAQAQNGADRLRDIHARQPVKA